MPKNIRLGIIILISILVVLFVLWRLIPVLYQPEDTEEIALQQRWDTFKQNNLITISRQDDTIDSELTAGIPSNKELFTFDPNTASEKDFIKLGLPVKTVKTILRYRSKGGRFYKKEDLSKIYNLKESDYSRLLPYINIAGNTNNKGSIYSGSNPAYTRNTSAEAQPVYINTATAEDLIRLPGIGPAYAKRIISFRDGLGGFLRIEQLKEVYGFPDSTYRLLKDRFIVDVSKVKKLNVNTATEPELAQHPYIGKQTAKNIIMLRDGLKLFDNIEQLRQVPLINEEKYRKIAPYLVLN